MILNVFIVNKEESEKGNKVGKWIKLPISLKELKKEMLSIGSILEKDLIIKNYKSNVNVKLNIDSETDIGYLNSQIIELNKYATDNENKSIIRSLFIRY